MILPTRSPSLPCATSLDPSTAYHRVADLFERIVQIKRQLGIENPCVVLVGNKCDRQDREVSYDAGASLAQRLGIPYFFEVRSSLLEMCHLLGLWY